MTGDRAVKVRVSATDWDFSKEGPGSAPRALYRDWAYLITELAHILDEDFHLPPLPENFDFERVVEYSDGPYPSDENYVSYTSYEYDHYGEEYRGLRLSYSPYGNSVKMQTLKAKIPITSLIRGDQKAPLAELDFESGLNLASPSQREAIQAALLRHHHRSGGA